MKTLESWLNFLALQIENIKPRDSLGGLPLAGHPVIAELTLFAVTFSW